jgi:hypothetical protein
VLIRACEARSAADLRRFVCDDGLVSSGNAAFSTKIIGLTYPLCYTKKQYAGFIGVFPAFGSLTGVFFLSCGRFPEKSRKRRRVGAMVPLRTRVSTAGNRI